MFYQIPINKTMEQPLTSITNRSTAANQGGRKKTDF